MDKIYSKLSSFVYDKTKPPGTSVDGDINFYKKQILPIDGKVLEAGVGNGRMFVNLLKYSVKMEGIDNSSEMLKLCRKNMSEAKVDATLIEKDLLEFKKPYYYSAIIMPNGSINLIGSGEKVRRVLENFYQSLIQGGKIIIDIIFPTLFKASSIHEQDFIISANERIHIKNHSKEIDWFKQKTTNIMTYDHFKDDKLIETQIEEFKLNWFGVEEFKGFILGTGFKDVEVYKNFDQGGSDLKTVTFIGVKL